RGASLGWLILTSGIVTLIVFGIGWLGSTGGTSSSVPVPSATTVVTIQSGQTLWEIATDEAPSSAPQDVVDRIQQLNNISDATLHPGERLVVPVEAAH
ncbi:MAG TPA: LysM peptidoglycan-binding domain-containing protein, partial [Pseudonocardiaceae bacterium]|nr:LysM peptidoglycan-binding domain-containing protein [Pseudonocardiaceae bacterium]